MRRSPRQSRRAFTLIELVVTSIIGVMLAGATAASVSQLVRTRAASTARQQAFARAESAAARISADLVSASRDHDATFCKVAIIDGGQGGLAADELLLLARSRRPLRGIEGSPEGDEFEVQFRVMAGPDGTTPWLWRRADVARDDIIDGGGVAAPLVDGIASLTLEATDGTEAWYSSWDSDSDGLPHAVRVTVVASSDDGRTLATARRVVAIDRVPLLPESFEEEGEEGDSADTPESTPAGTGSTGTSGGGTGGTGGGTGGGPRGGGTGGGGTGGGRPTTPGGGVTPGTGGTPATPAPGQGRGGRP